VKSSLVWLCALVGSTVTLAQTANVAPIEPPFPRRAPVAHRHSQLRSRAAQLSRVTATCRWALRRTKGRPIRE
jgi:hypothetical protein